MGQLTPIDIADRIIYNWNTREPHREPSEVRQMVNEWLAITSWAKEMKPIERVKLANQVADIIYKRLAATRAENLPGKKRLKRAQAFAERQHKLF